MPQGSVDRVTATQLSGWVWDDINPSVPAEIDIFDGDELLLTVTADVYRADLEAMGLGDGRHGFQINHLGRLLPRLCHRITVRRRIDGMELPGSPQWLINPLGLLDDAGMMLLDDIARAVVHTASDPATNDRYLDAFMDCTRRIAAARAAESGQDNSPIGLLRRRYPALELKTAAEPEVSVIVPVFGQLALTYDCLASIAGNVPETPFEIIIVDDASTDDTLFAALLLGAQVRLIRRANNAGFIAACNEGAAAARGRHLLFLNNDTIVQDGWLDKLVATFRAFPEAGIVGSRLLNGDGTVQEAGGIVWRMGDAWNWGRGQDPSDPRFTFLRDADYVSGAALMVERALFEQLGGFDRHFAPGYYEDTDLAFRVRAQGRRVMVQPASEIIHLEGASSGRDPEGSGPKRHQLTNQVKFFRRWRHVLAQHRMNGVEPELEAERLVERRAWFIDDTVPTPDQDAGSNVAVSHMRMLRDLGYKVTFIPSDNMARIDPYTALLEREGIACAYAPFNTSVEQMFRTASPAPDLIYMHRLSNASKYGGMARMYLPSSKLVYNVADLHFLRLEREAALTLDPELQRLAQRTQAMEITAMLHVHAVIVHSAHEANLLESLVPGLNVHVVAWPVAVSGGEAADTASRRDIAFVGGYQHKPNVDAAVHLVQDVMPLVWKERPDLRCRLIGSKVTQAVRALAGPRVFVDAYVSDLTAAIQQVRCTVAPLRYGAGIKGKVLSSFAAGVPCVMSPVAAEGLSLPDDLASLVGISAQDMARIIVDLDQDAGQAARLGASCRDFMTQHFGQHAVTMQLDQVLQSAARAAQNPTSPMRVRFDA